MPGNENTLRVGIHLYLYLYDTYRAVNDQSYFKQYVILVSTDSCKMQLARSVFVNGVSKFLLEL